jgi:hypothetical protein
MKKGVYDRFFALLNQMPSDDKDELKEQLVWQYSGMLTASLKEFAAQKPEEYKRMLADMQVQVEKFNPKRFREQETKRLRSAILNRLQKYGIDTTQWPAVNKFLQQPRIGGKRLYEMSNEEMALLIPKLENILKKDVENREKERDLAFNN